jgi:hypothetical protein
MRLAGPPPPEIGRRRQRYRPRQPSRRGVGAPSPAAWPLCWSASAASSRPAAGIGECPITTFPPPRRSHTCDVASVAMRRMLCLGAKTQPSAATGRRRRAYPAKPGPPSRAAHHGCGLSRDVTTKSVRSLPQLEHRKRSCAAACHRAQRRRASAGRPPPGAGSRPCTRRAAWHSALAAVPGWLYSLALERAALIASGEGGFSSRPIAGCDLYAHGRPPADTSGSTPQFSNWKRSK